MGCEIGFSMNVLEFAIMVGYAESSDGLQKLHTVLMGTAHCGQTGGQAV